MLCRAGLCSNNIFTQFSLLCETQSRQSQASLVLDLKKHRSANKQIISFNYGDLDVITCKFKLLFVTYFSASLEDILVCCSSQSLLNKHCPSLLLPGFPACFPSPQYISHISSGRKDKQQKPNTRSYLDFANHRISSAVELDLSVTFLLRQQSPGCAEMWGYRNGNEGSTLTTAKIFWHQTSPCAYA